MTWLKFGQRSKIRQQTLQLVSLLSRWCQVREDLLYAFEKSLDAGLENPMRQAVADFLSRVRGGMEIGQALDLFQDTLDHENLRDLITAIRFNFRHRGNLPALLESLEVQLHKIEEEYNRRRLSNARDLSLTLLILTLVPLFFTLRLAGNPDVCQLFLNSPIGLCFLVICLLSYGMAVIWTLIIQRRISG